MYSNVCSWCLRIILNLSPSYVDQQGCLEKAARTHNKHWWDAPKSSYTNSLSWNETGLYETPDRVLHSRLDQNVLQIRRRLCGMQVCFFTLLHLPCGDNRSAIFRKNQLSVKSVVKVWKSDGGGDDGGDGEGRQHLEPLSDWYISIHQRNMNRKWSNRGGTQSHKSWERQ